MSPVNGQPELGIYIHWPFCQRICPYCDFNVLRQRGHEALEPMLADAICADLEGHRQLTGERSLKSIYFGGGTPSLMTADQVARIIELCRRHWRAVPDLEISLEANPSDIQNAPVADFAGAGVNRLSIGVQSLNDETLKFLGRNHDAASARVAVLRCAKVFDRVSVDAIFGTPGQSVSGWQAELEAICDLGAGHISTYQLTIEAGTAFDRAVRRKLFQTPDDDLSADLFDATQATLGARGFQAYEVSNHARSDTDRSRHNLIYWQGHDYIGVGPGAHGRLTLDGRRHTTRTFDKVADYCQAVSTRGSGHETIEVMSELECAEERLYMGLRLREGISFAQLGVTGLNAADQRVAELIELNLVQPDPGRLMVTADGRRVLDSIIRRLLV